METGHLARASTPIEGGQLTLYFNDSAEMEKVLGINDSNLSYLEYLHGGDLHLKGNSLAFEDPDGRFSRFMSSLIAQSGLRDEPFAENELFMEWKAQEEDGPGGGGDNPSIIVNGRSLWPKSRSQKRYIRSLQSNQVVFATGPAGTGKTYIAIAHALSQVLTGHKRKIVLTRPVVEAGESLGFLPGDLSQKLNPYLKPLYDAMEAFLNPAQVRRLEETGVIEVSPLAYMRGRSINGAVVILDEAQNTTVGQMKMFLSRLGEDSQAVVTGDLTQVDLPRGTRSGLVHALSILHDIEGLDVVAFHSADIIRSRLVKAIIGCYQEEEER